MKPKTTDNDFMGQLKKTIDVADGEDVGTIGPLRVIVSKRVRKGEIHINGAAEFLTLFSVYAE